MKITFKYCRLYQCRSRGNSSRIIDFYSGEELPGHELSGEFADGDLFFFPYKCSVPVHVCSEKSAVFSYFMEFKKTGIYPLHNEESSMELEHILEKGIEADSCLKNYEDIPFVTIDNDGSKDLDQAVYVSETDMGFKVVYALADASFFVHPESELFREALRRGSSYYFPGYSLPMLPRELSEGLISLNPGEKRRALVFSIFVDLNGNALETSIERAFIISRHKLSYSQVQKFYDENSFGDLPSVIRESLISLQNAGRILYKKSLTRGVINYHRHELDISIDEGNNGFIVENSIRTDAARWNEQVSVLCNMEGAREIARLGKCDVEIVQPLFRIHEPPTEGSLKRLNGIITDLVKIHSLDSALWGWGYHEGESLAAYLDRLPRQDQYSAITETIEQQILVTNKKSVYSEKPMGHYALRAELYGRFSSPMREIVGIYTHKELLEKLGYEKNGIAEMDLQLREEVIDSGNRSKDIQKDMDRMTFDHVLDYLFSEELEKSPSDRQVYKGIVLGVKSSRIYLRIHNPSIEVKMYVDTVNFLLQDRLEISENSLELVSAKNGKTVVAAGSLVEFKIGKYEKGKWIPVPVRLCYAGLDLTAASLSFLE